MKSSDLETFLQYIKNEVSSAYDIRKVTSLYEHNSEGPKDSAHKFYLPGISARDDAILMISNEHYPDFIKTAVGKVAVVRSQLSDRSNQAVLKPAYSGVTLGRSFVIWPKHNPISENKFLRAVQKRTIAKNIYRWLIDVAKDSVKREFNDAELEKYIQTPLKMLVNNPNQSEMVRSRANAALDALSKNKWQPFTTIQHSDFWLGNILIARKHDRENEYGIYLIDWGAASLHGGPAFDLIDFFISVNASKMRALKELSKYCDAINIRPEDVERYLLLGLGVIGSKLEQFPEERFAMKSSHMLNYLDNLRS